LHARLIPEAAQPTYLRFAAEPRHLALGVIAVRLLRGLDGLLAREFATQELYCLLVTEGRQRPCIFAIFF